MLGLLYEEAEAQGRDPKSIEITLSAVASTSDAGTLEKVKEWGASRVVMAVTKKELGAAKDELASLADRVGLDHRR